MLCELEIDIAIDFNAFAGGKSGEILSHRPAPVQVNCLGYPGTTGAPVIDYIIADRIVIPKNIEFITPSKSCTCRTPICRNTNHRLGETPSRIAAGLPEKGFRLRLLQFCSQDLSRDF